MNAGADSYIVDALKVSRVLVADASPLMQQLVMSMLRAMGVGVVVRADDPVRALATVRDGDIDCAVVDWMLEEPSGIEFLKDIRALDGDARQLPVVMCTAYTDRARVLAMRDAGANEIVAKPLAADKLFDRMISALFASREFIFSDAFVGPDRRRKRVTIDFPDRRREGLKQGAVDEMFG